MWLKIYGHSTESVKKLIKLSLMICKHWVWELFDRKKKHRGLCQINGLNPQCLWVNSGDERTRNFIYPLNTLRYWISFIWVSISKFQITTKIRVGRWYSNQIEFWVLIYYKFNATTLMVLIEVLFTVPITIEEGGNIHVRLSHLLVGSILSILLVPPRIHLFVYHDYTII